MFTGAAASFGDFKEYGLAQSVTFVFREPGIYPYFCALHPSMAGALVVGDASASTRDTVPDAEMVLGGTPEADGGLAPAGAASADDRGGRWDVAAAGAMLLAAAGAVAWRLGRRRN